MSRSTRKDPTTTDRKARAVKPMSAAGLGDLSSKQLQALAKQGGNQALDAQLQQKGAMRDQLVQHIIERLQAMHQVQTFEKLEMGRERQWFKAVAKGEAGYHLPDPTRWHQAAHLFHRAAVAMCNGNLGHGAQLMEQALEAERAAYDSLPTMVEQHLDHTNDRPADAPVVIDHVPTHAACPSRALPQELRVAQQILNIQDVMEATPPLSRRRGNAWWLEEEEDEDEEEDE